MQQRGQIRSGTCFICWRNNSKFMGSQILISSPEISPWAPNLNIQVIAGHFYIDSPYTVRTCSTMSHVPKWTYCLSSNSWPSSSILYFINGITESHEQTRNLGVILDSSHSLRHTIHCSVYLLMVLISVHSDPNPLPSLAPSTIVFCVQNWGNPLTCLFTSAIALSQTFIQKPPEGFPHRVYSF